MNTKITKRILMAANIAITVLIVLLELEHGNLSARDIILKAYVWLIVCFGVLAMALYRSARFFHFTSVAQICMFLPLLAYGLTLDS